MNYPMVRVEWDDAATADDWDAVSGLANLTTEPCETVGFLLHRDSERVVVASSIGGEDGNSATVIPAGCVRKVTTLVEVEDAVDKGQRN